MYKISPWQHELYLIIVMNFGIKEKSSNFGHYNAMYFGCCHKSTPADLKTEFVVQGHILMNITSKALQ